ncbi:hypothetical protein [Bradyrhizobium sp. LA2.1]|uniref:hypothetical protein n=1 Tax=Bradyrhizobium sp. LA2.1 TaxID=3156376 RepID=UPI0033971A52
MTCETCSRATRGWFEGCLTASAIIESFFLFLFGLVSVDRLAVLSVMDFVRAVLIGVPIILTGMLVILFCVCALSGIPSAVAIWVSERLCIRSLAFFGLVGGLAGAAGQIVLYGSFDNLGWLFVVAGGFAGLHYWRVAGRFAGTQARQSER